MVKVFHIRFVSHTSNYKLLAVSAQRRRRRKYDSNRCINCCVLYLLLLVLTASFCQADNNPVIQLSVVRTLSLLLLRFLLLGIISTTSPHQNLINPVAATSPRPQWRNIANVTRKGVATQRESTAYDSNSSRPRKLKSKSILLGRGKSGYLLKIKSSTGSICTRLLAALISSSKSAMLL